MSVDPRRGNPFCTPTCYRECRCSRWPDYVNRFGHPVRPDTETYVEKVLGYGPIIYFIMDETVGLTAVNYGTLGTAANGTYVGVTLNDALGPDGVNGAPFFDGANDYLNAMATTTLRDAWNAGGAEWTVMYWWRVANAGVWTDGISRSLQHAIDTANDYCYLGKHANNDSFMYGNWVAGGVVHNHFLNGTISTTDWTCTVMTRSEAADEIRYYLNGAWLATDTIIGNWASAGAWGDLTLFAGSTVPNNSWHGWGGHVAMWNSALGAPTIADLAMPTP